MSFAADAAAFSRKRSHSLQKSLPGSSSRTIGCRSLLPVCISVSSSNASSIVPKPPGNSAKPSDSLMNVTLRVKKYLKLMSLVLPWMKMFGSDSSGSRIEAPKLFSAPAPSWPGGHDARARRR